MESFVLKIIVSFFVGGLFIAAQSMLAERLPSIGGLVISIPCILPIDLLFIGWSEGREAAIEAASIVPTSIALILLFSCAFIYAAQYGSTEKASLAVANVASLSTWFVLAFLAIRFEFDTLGRELGAYLLVMVLTGYLLYYRQRGQVTEEMAAGALPTVMNIGLRALFGGCIISSSVILSRVLSPLWGGMFSVFPASYLSTFNIIHRNAGRGHLLAVGKTIPEGSIFFLIYIALAEFLFTLGIFWGTVLSESMTIGLMVIYAKLRHLTGFKQR